MAKSNEQKFTELHRWAIANFIAIVTVGIGLAGLMITMMCYFNPR